MINNIKYIEKLPEEYIAENIGSGNRAICFKGKENEVCKIFAFGEKPSIDKLNYLSNLNIDRFIFPKKVLVKKEENNDETLVGYLMEYVSGTEMDGENFVIDIKFLLKEIMFFEDKLDELLQANIVIADIQPRNMMHGDDNKIYFFDTDCYSVEENTNALENRIQLNKGFKPLVLPRGFQMMIGNVFLGDIDLLELYHETFVLGKIKLSEFLITILEYFCEYTIKNNLDLKNALSNEITRKNHNTIEESPKKL